MSRCRGLIAGIDEGERIKRVIFEGKITTGNAAADAAWIQKISQKGDGMEMLRMFGMGILVLLLSGVLVLLNPLAGSASGDSPVNLAVPFLAGEDGELVLLRDLAGELSWGLEYLPREKAVLVKNGERKELVEVPAGQSRIIDGRTWIGLETAGRLLENLNPDLSALITGLYPLAEQYRSGAEIGVKLRAYNPGDGVVQLDFSSGQRYDLYLKRNGQEIWRWSEGRFFTMALARIELQPGEGLVYELTIPTAGLEAGVYTVGGELSTLQPLQLNEVEIRIL